MVSGRIAILALLALWTSSLPNALSNAIAKGSYVTHGSAPFSDDLPTAKAESFSLKLADESTSERTNGVPTTSASPATSTRTPAQTDTGTAGVSGTGVSTAGGTTAKTPFSYEFYEDLMEPIPDQEQERLCGLDKVCINLWKKGKLEVYKEGRLFTGDFNEDGVPDEAIVLEKDQDEDSTDKDYLISITSKIKGVRKVLLHEIIPNAHNVLDSFWDPVKKAIVIDTGGRVVRSDTVSNYGGTGYTYQSGQVLKVVVVVVWNAKTQRFDLITPTFGKTKHGRKSD